MSPANSGFRFGDTFLGTQNSFYGVRIRNRKVKLTTILNCYTIRKFSGAESVISGLALTLFTKARGLELGSWRPPHYGPESKKITEKIVI